MCSILSILNFPQKISSNHAWWINFGEICLFVQFARGVPNCSGESKQTDEQLLPEDPSCEAKAQTSLTLFRLLTSCGVAGSLPYRELVPDCGCRDPRQAGQRDFSPAWLHDLKWPLAKLWPIGWLSESVLLSAALSLSGRGTWQSLSTSRIALQCS